MTSHILPHVLRLHRPWWSRALDSLAAWVAKAPEGPASPDVGGPSLETLSTRTLADIGAGDEVVARGHARDNAHRANQQASLRGLRSDIGVW